MIFALKCIHLTAMTEEIKNMGLIVDASKAHSQRLRKATYIFMQLVMRFSAKEQRNS